MMARRLTTADVTSYAQLAGVPVPLALAVFQQESSSGRNTATSPKGAVGAFQVMPDTFKRYVPGGDINDPVDNMQAGMAVIRDGLQKYGNDWEKAAQFYYHGSALSGGEGPSSGPGTPTTRQYGQRVLALANQIARDRGGDTRMASLATPSAGMTSTSDNLFGGDTGADFGDVGMDFGSPDNMAGFTPTSFDGNFGGEGDFMANEEGSKNYDLERYIRKMVDEELKPNA